MSDEHDADNDDAPEPSPPQGRTLLWLALIAHLLVLAARAQWVETDPEQFRRSALSGVAVFLLGPAILVGVALGVPSRWNRARMWHGVAVAWLVTAVVHGLIVLGALTGQPPAS